MPTKTRAAIAKWLEKQEWYEAYCDNLVLQSRLTETIRRFLAGIYEEDTICAAFSWSFTPEGDSYWRDINKQFTAWYYGD